MSFRRLFFIILLNCPRPLEFPVLISSWRNLCGNLVDLLSTRFFLVPPFDIGHAFDCPSLVRMIFRRTASPPEMGPSDSFFYCPGQLVQPEIGCFIVNIWFQCGTVSGIWRLSTLVLDGSVSFFCRHGKDFVKSVWSPKPSHALFLPGVPLQLSTLVLFMSPFGAPTSSLAGLISIFGLILKTDPPVPWPWPSIPTCPRRADIGLGPRMS